MSAFIILAYGCAPGVCLLAVVIALVLSETVLGRIYMFTYTSPCYLTRPNSSRCWNKHISRAELRTPSSYIYSLLNYSSLPKPLHNLRWTLYIITDFVPSTLCYTLNLSGRLTIQFHRFRFLGRVGC